MRLLRRRIERRRSSARSAAVCPAFNLAFEMSDSLGFNSIQFNSVPLKCLLQLPRACFPTPTVIGRVNRASEQKWSNGKDAESERGSHE